MTTVILFVLQAILVPLGWFWRTLLTADASGVYVGIFAAVVVVRVFVKPLVGDNGKAGDD